MPTTLSQTGDQPIAIICCDIDRDGDADLITANDLSDSVSVLTNNGTGDFADPVQWSVDNDGKLVSEPVDVACCDIDGDNDVDLVTANHTSDDVSVLLNNGMQQFALAGKHPVGEAPFKLVCVNLDGVANIRPDIVTANITGDSISVLLNDGTGVFPPRIDYPAGDGAIALAVCDVDRDSVPDVVTSNMLGKSISSLRNDGNGVFTLLDTEALGTNPFYITCCDLDGADGPDVATANGLNDTMSVFLNDGAGRFGPPSSYPGADGAWGLTCCDIDADNDGDVIVSNLTSDDLSLYTNNGAGTFAAALPLPVGGVDSDPASPVCCNLDTDLDLDLLTTYDGGAWIIENTCGPQCTDDLQCDDGVPCTIDSCSNGQCQNNTDHTVCDDGLFCTGAEFCDSLAGCIQPGNPCPDPADCNEQAGHCGCKPPVVSAAGPRYLAITPDPLTSSVALQIVGVSSDVDCVAGFVNPDGRLVATPTYLPSAGPGGWNTITVRGLALVSSATYAVRADCDINNPGADVSDAASATLWRWGDVDHTGIVDILDAVRILDGFQSRFHSLSCVKDADCTAVLPHQQCDTEVGRCHWITRENVDLIADAGCAPDGVISIVDVVNALDAFRGFLSPCAAPCP